MAFPIIASVTLLSLYIVYKVLEAVKLVFILQRSMKLI